MLFDHFANQSDPDSSGRSLESLFSIRKGAEYSWNDLSLSHVLVFGGEDLVAAESAIHLDHLPSQISFKIAEDGEPSDSAGVDEVRRALWELLKSYKEGSDGYKIRKNSKSHNVYFIDNRG